MTDGQSHLSFHLAGRRHAIPMECVLELVYLPLIQATERVPGNILGIFSLRGEPVAVLDLAALLGLDPGPLSADDVMLIIRTPAGAGPYGLIVSTVEDLLEFAPEELKPPVEDPECQRLAPLVAWLGLREERLYHLLDLDLVVATALQAKAANRFPELFGTLPAALEAKLLDRAERATERHQEAAGSHLSCLDLGLGGERFALPLRAILRIAPCPPVFPVPGAPPAILGLVNLGSEPLLAVDLRPLLGMPRAALLPQAFLVVVEDGAGALGLYAEDLGEVLSIDLGELQARSGPEPDPVLLGDALQAGLVFHVLDLPLVLGHPGLSLATAPR
jgi:chemotaxis signal transduction protein